ncbi:MAG: S8 family serine peptidase [Nitrosomonadales bacterium]|nr:S8 family serine peptidase [Nitrosomonadales bacterium]
MDARFGDWNKPAMHGVRRAFEAKYQFQATGMFSWVGNGFSAYLTPAQAKALQRDPQVVRISEDHEMEFSAVWMDQPLAGTEKMPWNISAVAGNQLSGGSVRAYVLDAGVGYHNDLPNVISRLSAAPLMPVVNCYPHATHVAGIISAPRNNVGVVGVDSSVPVVSVSATQSGTKMQHLIVEVAALHSKHIRGLDQIKSLISASGRVGVINISINPQDNTSNYFASATPLGQKMLSMATPVSGYPGAFIAQSAGNYGKLACRFAYDNFSTDDGIMVVGAVDINGQPVVRLNSIDGFRSMPIAANQAGSNFGSSVAIWAPGNNIYSTWATWNAALANSSPTALKARQSGNTTYNVYGQLSGTSMAAPHVAGVAAWLAETGNLTTPAQIEAAVRNYARTNGAKDPDTNPILIANAIGTSYNAQPTVEFAIGGLVNGNLNTNSATPFALSYESIGHRIAI